MRAARALLVRHRPVVRAVAVTVVPEASGLTDAAWAEVESIIEGALAERPPALLRQLSLFLGVIDALSLARHGRRFAGLDHEARARLLRRFETSPLLLVRRGFWGLRTLVLMGFYARPDAGRAIGYRADARGWEARA